MRVRQKIFIDNIDNKFSFCFFSSVFHYLSSTAEKISPNNYTYTIEQTGPPSYFYIFRVLSYSFGYIHYTVIGCRVEKVP